MTRRPHHAAQLLRCSLALIAVSIAWVTPSVAAAVDCRTTETGSRFTASVSEQFDSGYERGEQVRDATTRTAVVVCDARHGRGRELRVLHTLKHPGEPFARGRTVLDASAAGGIVAWTEARAGDPSKARTGRLMVVGVRSGRTISSRGFSGLGEVETLVRHRVVFATHDRVKRTAVIRLWRVGQRTRTLATADKVWSNPVVRRLSGHSVFWELPRYGDDDHYDSAWGYRDFLPPRQIGLCKLRTDDELILETESYLFSRRVLDTREDDLDYGSPVRRTTRSCDRESGIARLIDDGGGLVAHLGRWAAFLHGLSNGKYGDSAYSYRLVDVSTGIGVGSELLFTTPASVPVLATNGALAWIQPGTTGQYGTSSFQCVTSVELLRPNGARQQLDSAAFDCSDASRHLRDLAAADTWVAWFHDDQPVAYNTATG